MYANDELSKDCCKATFDAVNVDAKVRKSVKRIPVLVRFNLMKGVTANLLDVFQSEAAENIAEDIRRSI